MLTRQCNLPTPPHNPPKLVKKLDWDFMKEKEIALYLLLFPTMISTLFSENVALIAFWLFTS